MKRRIADYLCRFACYLRGEKWYVADTWHGVPGNRAAELRQKIWLNVVLLGDCRREQTGTMAEVDGDLTALAQLAGEAHGHVWPKEAAK